MGLPLAISFSEAGFPVVGIDIDTGKIESLRQGISHVPDVSSSKILDQIDFHSNYLLIGKSDVVIICVPTPLGKTRDPDLSYLVRAGESVGNHLHKGMLVVLESTTYPGTTEELIQPLLESSGVSDWT